MRRHQYLYRHPHALLGEDATTEADDRARLRKMPTLPARRRTSLFNRSLGLFD